MDSPCLQLWWLPVGAGGHFVVHTSRWWEHLQALADRRAPQPLFHSALIVLLDGVEYVIEMSPAWGPRTPARGVVATGPVGLRPLGACRLFRYEVRCWPDGVLPDRRYAAGAPVVYPLASKAALDVLARVPEVPRRIWGREMPGTQDMWNSNSVSSWLLEGTGIDAEGIRPPNNGRAPGWFAGIAAFRNAPPGRPGSPGRA